jgi:putative hydrolase
VQNYFRSQLKTLIDSLDFDPARMQSAFEGLEMLDPERMAEALQDPQRLISAASTPLSSDATARLQAFMTLAEGYATFVMDAVGAKLLSDHGRLKEAMERRRQSVSPGDALLERLLGLELKRRQYEDGVKFCRYIAGMHDVAALNRAWENPDTLPTMQELADPDLWIARVLDAGGAEAPPAQEG